jgi:hypothetical protein
LIAVIESYTAFGIAGISLLAAPAGAIQTPFVIVQSGALIPSSIPKILYRSERPITGDFFASF